MSPRISALVIFVLTSCGPTTFVDFCKRSAIASCKTLFRCAGSQAMQLYANQAACESDLISKAKCAEFESVECPLDSGKASKCLADVEAADCSSTGQPASCRELMCINPTGGPSCKKSSNSASGGTSGTTCTLTKSECSDGATYSVSFANGTVSCDKSGTIEKTFEDSGFCDKSSSDKQAAFKSQCGWAFP